MRTSVSIAALLVALSVAPAARAQEVHTASPAALDAALQQHVSADTADRAAIIQLLERDEVKRVAGQTGLDLRRAQSAIATLSDAELARVAAQAQQVEQALAGGQSTITVSTTLIIIVLLVIILIVVAT